MTFNFLSVSSIVTVLTVLAGIVSFMSTLDRMFFWNYLRNYLIWLVCLVTLYVVVDLFTNLSEYTNKKDNLLAVLKHIGGYYAVQVWLIFDKLSEFVTVLAGVFTVALIQRNNELLPQLSAGVPTRRVIRPVVLGSILTLALGPLNTEFVIPRLADQLTIPRDDPERTKPITVHGAFDPRTKEHVIGGDAFVLERKISRFEYTSGADGGAKLVHLTAGSAAYFRAGPDHPEAGWELYDAKPDLPQIDLPPNVQKLAVGKYFVKTTAVDFDAITRRVTWYLYASTTELWSQLQGGDPINQSGVAVLFHTRLVRPLAGLVLVLLCLAVILRNQNRHVFISAGLCLLLGAAFMIGSLGCRLLGEQDAVPSALAAWLPVIVFGPPAVFLYDAMHT